MWFTWSFCRQSSNFLAVPLVFTPNPTFQVVKHPHQSSLDFITLLVTRERFLSTVTPQRLKGLLSSSELTLKFILCLLFFFFFWNKDNKSFIKMKWFKNHWTSAIFTSNDFFFLGCIDFLKIFYANSIPTFQQHTGASGTDPGFFLPVPAPTKKKLPFPKRERLTST